MMTPYLKTRQLSEEHKAKSGTEFKIGFSYITASASVRNLDLILVSILRIEKQVDSTRKSCYYQIRSTSLVHKYLNKDICKILVQVLVIC